MGRFTSVQGFADNNSNNRTITYDQAKGSTDAKSNNNNSKKLVTEKVVNPYGSTSGAGSGEFHVYRHARAREMARWNALDLEAKDKKEQFDFRANLEDDRKQVEAKASKNRKKRQREKEAKRRKKCMKAAGIDLKLQSVSELNHNIEDNEGEEEFTYKPEALQQQQKEREEKKENSSKEKESSVSGPSSDGDLVIPNDGSFLETMKRKFREERNDYHEQKVTTNKKENNKDDKRNEKGGSFGDATATKDIIKKTQVGGEESDEEGPALPPIPS